MPLDRRLRQRLSQLKPFILDNSLRESTVGSIYEHTIEQKHEINAWASRCNIQHQIVASLVADRRVDDLYVKDLGSKHTDLSKKYCFSDVFVNYSNGDQLPAGLIKMKALGIYNPILEIDIVSEHSLKAMVQRVDFLLNWIEDNLKPPTGQRNTVFVNLRDFHKASMLRQKDMVKLVIHLARRNPKKMLRPAGLLYEDPSGEFMPSEMGAWTKRIRTAMDKNGWRSQFQRDGKTVDGLFLAHAHKAYGMADAVMMECLANGADGTWASLAEEGALCGHACSTVLLTNLARFGNKWVCENFNMDMVTKAARAITMITTGVEVDCRQIVYGPKAADTIFMNMDMPLFDRNGDGSVDLQDEFALWKLFGMKEQPVRVTALCPAEYLLARLKQCFGEDEAHFTMEVAGKMRTYLLNENTANRGDEHSSAIGLAMLYHEATHHITPAMRKTLQQHHEMSVRRERLLDEAHDYFCQDPSKKRRISTQGHALWAEVNEGVKQTKPLVVVDEEDDSCFGFDPDDGFESEASQSNLLEMRDGLVGASPSMPTDEFYHRYVQVYFENWPSDVVDSLELDDDVVTWDEFEFWCVYSLREHGAEIHTLDQLHRDVLRQLMLTVKLQRQADHRASAISMMPDLEIPAGKGKVRALARSKTQLATFAV
eukprot:m.46766 g.46766  ORF g.46766 m.46766 type:complete len:654 (+) comp13174_c0_seq1:70-2031(+)